MSDALSVLLWMIRLIFGVAAIILFTVGRQNDGIMVAIFMLLANQDLILLSIDQSRGNR